MNDAEDEYGDGYSVRQERLVVDQPVVSQAGFANRRRRSRLVVRVSKGFSRRIANDEPHCSAHQDLIQDDFIHPAGSA